jgi:RimJ/RimL family protein N-acetyltransferase
LNVRPFQESDYQDLYEYLSLPVTYDFEPGKPISLAEAKELALHRSKGKDFLAVTLKQNGKMIGHIYFTQMEPKDHLTWEIGYIFNPKYQQKGYASEAAAALVKYGFDNYKIHRVMARCSPENPASWKLLESIGFKREGYFKKYGCIHKDGSGNPIWNDVYE